MSKPSGRSGPRGRRRRTYALRRTAVWVLAVAVIAAGLMTADRLGVFGTAPRPDMAKYDGRTFEVVEIVDGDTFDVDVPDGKYDDTRIRLWGVDTPEVYDPNDPEAPPMHFGPEASAFTRERVAGRAVRLELLERRTRGLHGRLLAYVYLPDGTMLNRLLIERGYAYADPRFEHPRREAFRRLQREARREGRGLWAEATDADLPDYYRGRLDLTTAPTAEQ